MARSTECTEDSALRDDSALVLSGYHPLSFSSYESVPTRYDQSLVTAVTPRRMEEVAKKVELERSLVTDRETTPRTTQLLGSDSERFSSLQNTKGGLNEPTKQPVQAVGTDPPPTTGTLGRCVNEQFGVLAKYLSIKAEKQKKLFIHTRESRSGTVSQSQSLKSVKKKATESKKIIDPELLEALYKRVARWDVDQYRSDLKRVNHEIPHKTMEQIKSLSEDQTIEYIKVLHRDNEYVGRLAVEAKSGLQRLSAENEFLKQKLEDMQHKLDMMQMIYTSKLKPQQ